MTSVRLAAAARLIVTGSSVAVGVGVVVDVLPQPVKAIAAMTKVVNTDTMKLVFLRAVIYIFLSVKLLPKSQTERRFIDEASSSENAREKSIPSFPNTGGIDVSINTHRPVSIGKPLED